MFATVTRWAWAPAPVLLLAIFLLWAADWRTAYIAPPQVLLPLQFVFMTLVSVAVGYLASRTFLADGSSGLLLLVCGALAWGLWSFLRGAGPPHDAVLEAFRKVLPDLPTQVLERMFKSVGDSVPPALLAAISGMAQADALKAVAAIAPHAAGPIRRAAVHVIFRRDFRWPLSLTDRLLKDDEPEIRRLAVMKLVFDADLASVANVMAAATKPAPYDSDVALHLAELLRPHRRHPDVQKAWRQWLWCARRWKALLFVDISTGRRAA